MASTVAGTVAASAAEKVCFIVECLISNTLATMPFVPVLLMISRASTNNVFDVILNSEFVLLVSKPIVSAVVASGVLFVTSLVASLPLITSRRVPEADDGCVDVNKYWL